MLVIAFALPTDGRRHVIPLRTVSARWPVRTVPGRPAPSRRTGLCKAKDARYSTGAKRLIRGCLTMTELSTIRRWRWLPAGSVRYGSRARSASWPEPRYSCAAILRLSSSATCTCLLAGRPHVPRFAGSFALATVVRWTNPPATAGPTPYRLIDNQC